MDTHSPFGSTTNSSHNSSHNNSTSNLHGTNLLGTILHHNPSTTTTTTSSSTTNVGFTPEMRDKQARGKDPYAERSDEESDFEGGGIENRLGLGGSGSGSGFAGRNGGGGGVGVGSGRGMGMGMGRGMGMGMTGMTGRGGAGGAGGVGGGLSWGERNNVRRKVEISGNAKAFSSMSASNHHVDYDVLEKRRIASMFLNDPELLVTHAESSGMTIAGSRHHFMLMLCGYDNGPRKRTTQASSSVSSGSSSLLYHGAHQSGSGYNNSRV
ncbi:hypothetical protein B0T09DRAFT_390973 [Sordaria sp. MPI-SDFR-AT-0083]|nr:hypothetical protein B0T09DRAFT_390973 [Sordaria sp. MPI-SDFR-AT-0083]